METITICTIFGAFILLSYTLGLRNGQKLSNHQEVKMPNVNIPKKIKEYQQSKEEEKEQRKLNKILNNIEKYDGTSIGQEEVE